MGFALGNNFPVLDIIYSNNPIAIIKTGDRDLEIRKIKKILGKFFFTPYGVFELDSKYEYRYKKQSIYIYNSTNSKPLSIPALQKIQLMYRNGEIETLVKEMQKIDKAIKEANLTDPLKILEYIVKEKGGTAIDLATEKWLMGYRAYDPASIRVLITQAHQAKKAIQSMSPNIKGAIPLVIIMGVVLGFAMLIMNLGTILTAVADFVDRMRGAPKPQEFILGLSNVVDGVTNVGNFILGAIHHIM